MIMLKNFLKYSGAVMGIFIHPSLLKDYLKYSGVWIGIVLNPFHWRFKVVKGSEGIFDDSIYEISVYVGPFWIRVVIDDGSW